MSYRIFRISKNQQNLINDFVTGHFTWWVYWSPTSVDSVEMRIALSLQAEGENEACGVGNCPPNIGFSHFSAAVRIAIKQLYQIPIDRKIVEDCNPSSSYLIYTFQLVNIIFMCSEVRMITRNQLRSSTAHEPS